MTIGSEVRRARLDRALTQRALAARAGVPQSTVARIESGAIDPRSGTLQRLVRGLGYELALEPRLGDGVDRTLIRRCLALTPRERLEYLAASAERTRALRDAALRAR